MNIELQNVNTLPMPTWRWLKINETTINLNLDGTVVRQSPVAELSGIEVVSDLSDRHITTGMGSELDSYLEDNAQIRHTIIVSDNKTYTEPIIIKYDLQNQDILLEEILIKVGAGSCAKFIFVYASPYDASGILASSIRVDAQAGAAVEIIQLQTLGQGFTAIEPVGINTAEKATVCLKQLNLGAAKTYLSTDIKASKEVESYIDSYYIASSNQEVDINYISDIHGRRVNSVMNTHGILLHNAKKTMRGTLDFKRNSTESVGNESEHVLLLDSNVINKSIPLILCGEDNIEGNHSAAIGQMDEEQLFYLYSRGLSDVDIRNMQIYSLLFQIQSKLPESLHHYVDDYAKEAFQYE